MIKFAIVGYGNIGTRHALHIKNNPQAQLVAICDIDTDKLQQIQASGIPAYSDLTMMLLDFRPDVVCICTPNDLHCIHTVMALKARCHVVVEKPMALSVGECDHMIATALDCNRHIFAVKQNRYNPPVAAVKDLVGRKELGRILMAQVNCFWNRRDEYYTQSAWRGRKKQDGGCLFTQFSHFVDILYYLLGDMKAISGKTANYLHQDNTEFEDSGSFVMESLDGTLVNFNFTTCAYERNMEGSIVLLGEQGTVKIGGQYLNTIEYQCLSGASLPAINITAKENDYGLYKGSMSNHDKVIQNVVEVLRHNGVIMTGAIEGRAVVDLIERMYAAVSPKG